MQAVLLLVVVGTCLLLLHRLSNAKEVSGQALRAAQPQRSCSPRHLQRSSLG